MTREVEPLIHCLGIVSGPDEAEALCVEGKHRLAQLHLDKKYRVSSRIVDGQYVNILADLQKDEKR